MRKRYTGTPAALVLSMAIATAVGCTGTETGNGFEQEIRVAAHSSDPATYSVAIPGGGGLVTQSWITIGSLSFIEDGDCDEVGAAVTTEPLSTLNRASSPQTVTLEMPEADYCRLVVPLGGPAQLPAGAPPELDAEHGVVVIGDTAAGISFRIIAGAPTVAVEGSTVFALNEDIGGVFLGFDVATWLEGIDIDGGVVEAGVVTIDESNNTALLTAFEANLAEGIELYGDTNGNGEADPGEPTLATGVP